jgi:hypothetical protein
MPGLVPGIHVLLTFRAFYEDVDGRYEDVDGRDKPGHDATTGVDMKQTSS